MKRVLLVALSAWALTAPASAQDDTGAPPAAPPAAAPPPAAVPPPTTVYSPPVVNNTTTTTTLDPNYNFDSHLPSDSQSVVDVNQGDGFDLRRGGEGATVVRGKAGAPGLVASKVSGNTGVYVVQAGDTLSKISQQVYGQPWTWPKLWALNPQIQNPHWIYPGDQIRLAGAAGTTSPTDARTLGSGPAGPLRKQLVPTDSVFLRQMGYIDDPAKGIKGEIVGAVEPIQMMAHAQHVYIVLKPNESVEVGQQMTVFREVRDPPKVRDSRTPPGKLVKIQGVVQVEYVNLKTRVVRALVVESMDVVERGAKVGFLEHEYRIVPPQKASKDVTARVLTSMYPHVVMGKDQVVFLDRGKQDGLVAGNRLFVTRRGDTWRRTLVTTTRFARTRANMESATSGGAFEAVPLHGDEQDFPEEVVAELRIVRAHKFSSLALVTASKVEIVPGDRAIARAGF